MTKFFKQQGAFDALKVGQCVFQNQTGGKRYYVACTNEEYWKKYLEKGDRFGYELIMKGTPCHLYVDLDINKEQYNIHVTDVWVIMEKWIDVTLQCQFNIPEDHITKHLLFSSNEKKGSMHIVYNIKDRIFQTNAHVGAFMRGVKEVINIQSPENMSIFINGFVDMAIYTPNRLFRMLGCAKWGTARYLSNNETFTYENWLKTKVQPIESKEKYIEVTECDGSEPKYNMVNCTVDINDNYMKEAIDYISETHSKVLRKARFDHTLSVACNLNTKVCPFVGRSHTKNRLYAVINLKNNTYDIRCHSGQCQGKRSEPQEFPEEIQYAMNVITNRKIIHSTILFS